MKNYLKIIFSVIFIALTSVPAQADLALPPSLSPEATASGPPPADVPKVVPVQTEPVQTDPTQKPTKARTYYSYAHDDAEYSVSLPEAPTVTTIWSESPDTRAYLKSAPTDHAALGEVATYKLVDIDTEELFDVKITFLRADQSFLQTLNEDKIKRMLMKKYSEVALSNETFHISDGTGTLKWATLSGFTLDNHHHPAFYAIHYLVGMQSILVVETKYSIENKNFQEYYNHMVSSITYVHP